MNVIVRYIANNSNDDIHVKMSASKKALHQRLWVISYVKLIGNFLNDALNHSPSTQLLNS